MYSWIWRHLPGPLGVRRGTGDAGDLAHCLRVTHQRQAVPLSEHGKIFRGNRHVLAHDPEGVIFAQQRADDVGDDAVIEHVPGDTHAGMADRLHRGGWSDAPPREIEGAADGTAHLPGGRSSPCAGKVRARPRRADGALQRCRSNAR